MEKSIVNIDQDGYVTVVKNNGKYFLNFTINDYQYDTLEISNKLFNCIAEEFGDKEWNN